MFYYSRQGAFAAVSTNLAQSWATPSVTFAFGWAGTGTTRPCNLATLPANSATAIFCSVPAGSGNASVTVSIAGQTSNAVVFSYSRPVVTSATSASGVSTAGGSAFTVTGSNFGPFPSPIVTLGGVTQALVSFNDSRIIVNSTAGM